MKPNNPNVCFLCQKRHSERCLCGRAMDYEEGQIIAADYGLNEIESYGVDLNPLTPSLDEIEEALARLGVK